MLDIELRRINVLQLRVGSEAVFHFDFEKILLVIIGRGIGEHRGHADAVAGMDAIAETGYSLPFVHLAAGAEDMLLVIGTEKVRAAGVQATWCRSRSGQGAPSLIGEARVIIQQPTVERSGEEGSARFVTAM